MACLQIVNEIHKHRDFFHSKWSEFCQWVEKCAEKLERHYNNERKGHHRLQKLEQKGWIRWSYLNLHYLKLSVWKGPDFYAPPDAVMPINWLLKNGWNPRDANPKEQTLLDCAVLSVAHDHLISDSEPHICNLGSCKTNYFECYDFCWDLWTELKEPGGDARIQRAWDQAKVELPPEKPAETGRNATSAKLRKIWTCVKSIPRWIYVLVIFLSALLGVLNHLGWLEPIKEFIRSISLSK